MDDAYSAQASQRFQDNRYQNKMGDRLASR